MAKITTYNNDVINMNDNVDLDVTANRKNMENNYDRMFNGYYNPYEKRTNSLTSILDDFDMELREAGIIE